MSRQALGLIETIGLAAGIEAADAMIKSANVTLLGYELTKGGGMVTVKVSGDVGAVKAAVAAGVVAAQKINKVWSQHIIARPHQDLDFLIESPETVGLKTIPKEEENPPDSSWDLEKVRKLVGFDGEAKQEEQEPTCNLCHDPVCPRQRGEAKIKCIHYKSEDNDK